MLLKSRHDSNKQVINICSLFGIPYKTGSKIIEFPLMDSASVMWVYQNESDRDKEYDWAMSNLKLTTH